jgi:ABC-type cobalamin/Fe3+-siderophores transport system ATPase subunit
MTASFLRNSVAWPTLKEERPLPSQAVSVISRSVRQDVSLGESPTARFMMCGMMQRHVQRDERRADVMMEQMGLVHFPRISQT